MFVFQNGKFELTEKKSQSTTIILLNWNSVDLLKNCLSLIKKNTDPPYTIIIVDNGSTDESIDYLKSSECEKYTCIFNDKNLGFSGGMNVGIRASNKDDNIVLMNVDAEPQKNWLVEIYRTFNQNPNVGLIGPQGNNLPSGYQSLNFVEFDTRVNILMFYCVFISRALINKIGLLDEIYELGGYDDNDFSYRSILANFTNYICAKSIILHEPHQVTIKNGLPANLFEENRDIFHEKFHAVLTTLSSSHNLFNSPNFSRSTRLFCE